MPYRADVLGGQVGVAAIFAICHRRNLRTWGWGTGVSSTPTLAGNAPTMAFRFVDFVPFLFAPPLLMILVSWLPQIALWLPNVFYG